MVVQPLGWQPLHPFQVTLTDASPRPTHYGYSILQAILSLLAALGLFATAGIAFFFGLFSLWETGSQMTGLPIILLGAGLAACGVLLLPSAFFALRRAMGKPVKEPARLPGFLRPLPLFLAFLLLLLLGFWISQLDQLAWLLLPPIHILTVGIPVLIILYLAVRGLPLGTPQRRWGVFGSGLVLGPAIILAIESILLVILLVIGFVFISSQIELIDQLNRLAETLMQQQTLTEESLQLLAPWLTSPGLIIAVILFIGLLVPLVEEALKPVGVWLLAGFKLTPAAGFAAGALSGAGYAFFESLALSTSTMDWTAMVATRAVTAVIHILNTSLMGWALVLAWREKRYLNLGLTYLLVVIAHGAWNSLAVFNVVDTLLSQANLSTTLPLVSSLGPAAPFLLGGITLIMLAAIILMNTRLRNQLNRSLHGNPPTTD